MRDDDKTDKMPQTAPRKRVRKPLTPEQRERKRAREAAWYARNLDRVRAKKAAYRDAHREKCRAYRAAWEAANLEKRRTYRAAWYAAHREERRLAAREYNEAHREERRLATAAWRKLNPEKRRACSRDSGSLRRARKRNTLVVEKINRADIFARDAGKCHLCRRTVDPANWHLDHLVPLSKGGEHAPYNVAVSHPRCNMRKHAKRLPVQVPLLLPMSAPQPQSSHAP